MSYTKDDIPDFLANVGAQITDAEQRIDTDILEPVVFSDNFIRFQFQNKGLLNPKSRITFSFKNPGVADSFLPLGVGIGSLIQRSTFKIGGKTICEVDDWAHYNFYKSLFTDQQVTKGREQYLSGRAISNSVVYENNSDTSSYVGMDLGTEPTHGATVQDNDMKLQSFQELAQTPVFSLSLEELVPCLRSVQLPLFMLNEEVQLELTLSSTIGKRACMPFAALAEKDTPIELNQDDVRLIADYTFLEGDAMEQFKAANSDYAYTFLEPRLTKTTLASSAAWENQIRNVGGAGRRVPKMFVMLSSDKMGNSSTDGTKSAAHNQLTLLNDYRSIATYSGTEAGGTYDKLTVNIKKNDSFIFPIDRSNSALHYHGVQQTEGAVPQVTRAMYSRQGNSLQFSKFQTFVMDQSDELSGQFAVQAFRFPDGQRVDSRGLEIHYKYGGLDTREAPFVQRAYVEMEKRVMIKDGFTDTMYE